MAACPAAADAADLRGQVLDSRTGEPVARVQVLLLGTAFRTQSQAGGEFLLAGVPPGDYVLQASTVGYWMVKRSITIGAGQPPTLEIVLTPSGDKQVETIEVKAGPYDAEPSTSAVALEALEVQDLGFVLMDDPLRAAQNLPGVASNNEHDARILVRGAEHRRVGVYLDGVLLRSPFHGVPGPGNEADLSMTIFHGDSIESMSLDTGAATTRWADQTAGALSVTTREGNRRRFAARGKVGIMSSSVALEGPLGAGQRGSWMVSARLGYLGLILKRAASDTNVMTYDFQDVSGKLTYDLTRRHQVSVSLLQAGNSLDRSENRTLGLNNEVYSDGRYLLGTVGWRWAAGERLLLTQRAAWIEERGLLENALRQPLYRNTYGEWVWNGDVAWRGLNAGWTARRQRDDGAAKWVDPATSRVHNDDFYRGTAWRKGVYAQYGFAFLQGRIRLQAGGRWDQQSITKLGYRRFSQAISAASPQVSLTVDATPSTRLYAGWGQQVQYPDLTQSFSVRTVYLGSLLPLRATHATAALERRLGERTRLRFELYNRQDRDLPFLLLDEPRILGNSVLYLGRTPLWNSLRGYSRGWQVFFQRRSANGFLGWLSYSYGRAVLRNNFYHVKFHSDHDQRHTLNAYGGYRLRPSVHISGKVAYGSGFPIPGFFRQGQTPLALGLARNRNEVRLPYYARADVRVNKDFTYHRWKLTVFFETINVTNRKNKRLDSIAGWDASSRRVYVVYTDLLPILPAGGLAIEF